MVAWLVVAALALTPGQLLSASLKAARAQRSVHYLATAKAPGLLITSVGDAAVDRGVQRVTYTSGGRTGHVTVRVVANTAYVNGDEFTLINYVQLPAATATKDAGKWLRIPQTSPRFHDVAEGVRLSSTVDQIALDPPLTSAGRTTMQGRAVIGIRGHANQVAGNATATLYVRATGTPLPVEELAQEGPIAVKIVLGNWNERVTVTAPAGAVTLR